MNNVHLIL